MQLAQRHPASVIRGNDAKDRDIGHSDRLLADHNSGRTNFLRCRAREVWLIIQRAMLQIVGAGPRRMDCSSMKNAAWVLQLPLNKVEFGTVGFVGLKRSDFSCLKKLRCCVLSV